ncbi:translation initiation factor IF-2 [Pseudomonas nitroreducens]|uniref:Gp138 family membrane-puncturing spike protein n=1 Tax=Pseudomonas aeruginosa group TaxID=136841 RepID=UPI00147513EE|nr:MULTISPECIES: Gp138 family membrane-puncturing spike protein [Pseudomonas aeruginosa group]NMZ76621.1 translation initiation factor IF-2 [Pseudomonas nitroreducens]
MNQLERHGDPNSVVRLTIEAARSRTWTALPGIIESFDPAAMTCVVQLAIQGQIRDRNGALALVDRPLLTDCPVQFPAGGGCTLTFPVKPGDECLVVFASRCIDSWWQSGGIQAQAEPRMHDLSDGFALLGFRSQPRVIGAVSTSAAQLRSDDGATFVSVAPGGAVAITAPAGLTINADVIVNGKVTTTGDVKAGTISLQTHKHTGIQGGTGTSGGPTP